METGKLNKSYSLRTISLEDTGLFNYNGGQSSVYNRFQDNGINNLEDLFTKFALKALNYGKDKLGKNNYIHDEINGIINLLIYKYLGKIPDNLNVLLDYKINMNISVSIFPYTSYGFPGDVLKNIDNNSFTAERIDSFYKKLKSCGFDQTACKALIDIACEEKITDISLGEFLCSLDEIRVRKRFEKVQRELIPFFNILNILIDFYQKHCKVDTSSHKR